MISQNDLYDISFALVTIRNDIKNTLNNVILSKIIQVLACDEREFEDNQVRKALASIPGLDQARWRYVYHNNAHVNHRFLKKQVYIRPADKIMRTNHLRFKRSGF